MSRNRRSAGHQEPQPARTIKTVLVAVAVTCGAVMPAAPAGAQIAPISTCLSGGPSGLVEYTSDVPVTMVREGDDILFNGIGCGTIPNTDLIRINADPLTIDLTGGLFAPGMTDEGDDSSEIEIELLDGPWTLHIVGSAGEDHIVVGREDEHDCEGAEGIAVSALNLNGDEAVPDADIFDCESMFGNTGQSSIVGNDGADIVSLAGQSWSDDRISGYLTLRGGPGDDTLISGRSDDIIRGGAGIDTFDASWSDQFVWVVAGVKPPPAPGFPPLEDIAVGGDIGEDEIGGLERFMTGGGDDQFFGTDRAETFIAGAGQDEIWPRGGSDAVNAGADVDLIAYSDAPRRVVIDLQERVAFGDGPDVLSGVENVEATPFTDHIWGDGMTNMFWLGAGDDVAFGRGGPDQLEGDAGQDSLDGGLAADFVNGGHGRFDRCRRGPNDVVVACELRW
jgi:Ca2+-binding RTX toxin-like protein